MDTLKKRKKASVVGAYGYIKQKRREYLRKACVYAGIGIAIFIVGLLLNKFEKANIFTIIAVLFTLPMAKALVAYIVFVKYKPTNVSNYQSVYDVLSRTLENCEPMEMVMQDTTVVENQVSLYTDVIFTSTDKVMNFDFALLTNRGLYACLGKEGQEKAYITNYLKDVMKSYHVSCEVKVASNIDEFLTLVKKGATSLTENEATNELAKKTFNTFIVQ